MRRRVLVYVLCLLVSTFPLVLDAPTASAQGVGWGTEERVDTSNAGNAYVQVGVDSNGDAIAVWQQLEGTFYTVWANRYTVGTGWGTPETIGRNDTGDAELPQVAVDPSGNATAMWSEWDGIRSNIWANRYVVGTGWGVAELIETDNAGSAGLAQIVVDSKGDATAVWQQSDGMRYNIWANRYVVGTGWGAAQLIETDNVGNALYPQVGVDRTSNALAVWEQWDGARHNIWANRYVVGTGWGVAELIEVGTREAEYPQIAVDPSGNAVAVWAQWDITEDIYANRFTVGAGWGTPSLVETSDTERALSPQVAVEPSGNAFVAWEQYDGTRNHIWANRYVVGTGWGVAELIETNTTGNALYPQIEVDSTGNAVAIWWLEEGAYSQIWSNRYTATDTIPPVANAGPDQTVAARELVTFDGSASTDNVGIVSYNWTFDDGGRRTLWGVSPTYSFFGAGMFNVVLTVEDVAGNPDSDTVVITVNAGADQERPVADAGPDQSVAAGRLVTFDGSASTDNVGIVNYTWSFDDGGTKLRYGVMFAHRFNNVGAIAVTLTVRDAAGNTGTDTVVITVDPVPDGERPVAEAGPAQSVVAGTALTFDGSASADNVGIVNYTWTFDDGGLRTLYKVAPTYQFNDAGVFVVTLTVRDAVGNSDSDTVAIAVDSPPDTQSPVAEAGPAQSVYTDSAAVLDGTRSTDDIGIVNYTWSFTIAGTLHILYGPVVSYRFAVVGGVTVTLTVRDAAGNSGTDSVVITSTDRPAGGAAEVVSPFAIVAIVLLAALAAVFAILYLRARGRREEIREGETAPEDDRSE